MESHSHGYTQQCHRQSHSHTATVSHPASVPHAPVELVAAGVVKRDLACEQRAAGVEVRRQLRVHAGHRGLLVGHARSRRSEIGWVCVCVCVCVVGGSGEVAVAMGKWQLQWGGCSGSGEVVVAVTVGRQ
jgi:hypothetical protein